MKYVNQLEYPELSYVTCTQAEDEAQRAQGRTTTVKTSGCGLCAAVMVADRLLVDYDFDLDAAIRLAYDTEANYRPGLNYPRFAPAFAQKLGLKLEKSADPERLLCCLRTGGAAVVYVGGDRDGRVGVFSHRGHYVVAVSEEPDGRIAVLDPGYEEGRYEEEGRRGKVEVKNGVIALCSLQVLAEDTADAEFVYYLFWRA